MFFLVKMILPRPKSFKIWILIKINFPFTEFKTTHLTAFLKHTESVCLLERLCLSSREFLYKDEKSETTSKRIASSLCFSCSCHMVITRTLRLHCSSCSGCSESKTSVSISLNSYSLFHHQNRQEIPTFVTQWLRLEMEVHPFLVDLIALNVGRLKNASFPYEEMKFYEFSQSYKSLNHEFKDLVWLGTWAVTC